MRYKSFLILFLIMFTCCAVQSSSYGQRLLQTREKSRNVSFETTDTCLERLYTIAEQKCLSNIKDFGHYKVLVEGATYPNVWLETQPMGGEMYAKRNLEVAKNNQIIFMDHQRADGRLPGMVSLTDVVYAHYGWLQGFCFPEPALDMYFWLNKDKVYLQQLYRCLTAFDQYLWKYRDSDGNGCLESWCVYDTGEDNCIRLDGAPLEWPFDYPPDKARVKDAQIEIQGGAAATKLPVPLESMDVTSYSYSAREVLSKISAILKNGKASFWHKKAMDVQGNIRSLLWNNKKGACYDLDPKNAPVDILLINNLKCLYYGSFDQQMADAFIHRHLLNRKEFWTPMPLPSIAANDKAFRNVEQNNWSGQPQGLSFQRAIRALENYGHYAEVGLIGRKLIAGLKTNFVFTQQYDPFTMKTSNSRDGYGPTALSLLEYISRMYGIQFNKDRLYWSGLRDYTHKTRYEQNIQGKQYVLRNDAGKVSAYIDHKLIFSCSAGVRCITDLSGKISAIVGIDTVRRKISLFVPGQRSLSLQVKPNCVYKIKNNVARLISATPFNLPD